MSQLQITLLRAIVPAGALLLSSCAFSTEPQDLESAEVADETDALRIIEDEGGDSPQNRCLTDATGSLTASPPMVALGESSTLRWRVTLPSNCLSVRVYLNSSVVAKSGSLVVTPQANFTHRLLVRITGYGERVLAYRNIVVELPPRVDITSNDQVPLFVQAMQTDSITVVVANNVQLDLSNRQNITVHPGVVLRGGRSGLQPGPRLFTKTRPRKLFWIGPGVSNVRITGVRIEGPDMGSNERYGNSGINIDSAINVQIDHNEISGWSGNAIGIADTQGTAASPSPDATILPTHTVQVYDNYIHHNQAVGGDGYGVVAGDGAHPYIARNVFDWNRHAISADGSEGNGYTAYHNLVLENGGLHRWIPFPGFWTHTHQFDMHGRDNCGVGDIFSDTVFNCGPAGHTMLIRNNAFFYHDDDAIKLRGTPEVGMFVGGNVFANFLTFGSAVAQTESGLVEEPGNIYGYNGKLSLGTCDFDGDGINDSFMATGVNWWYRSGTTAPWSFLNASTRKLNEIGIGYFDGDNRCDISADGVTYPGGKPPNFRLPGNVGGGGVILGRIGRTF